MHEYHIVDGLVKTILETAGRAQATKITRVSLVMGEFSGLEESSVRLYLDNLSKSTLLENAEIIIRHEPALLMCKTCNKSFPPKKSDFLCPGCGAPGCSADTGKTFYVENIEIESP